MIKYQNTSDSEEGFSWLENFYTLFKENIWFSISVFLRIKVLRFQVKMWILVELFLQITAECKKDLKHVLELS